MPIYSKILYTTLLFFVSTLSFAQNGPGGIQDTSGNSALVLWLDADKIAGIENRNTITVWQDLSGYNHSPSTSNPSQKPHLRTNFLNGRKVVSFNGISEYLQGSLGTNFGAPATVIAVPFFDDINQASNENAYVVSIGTSSGNGGHFSITRRKASGGDGNRYYSWVNDGLPQLGDTILGATWNIISQINASSSPFHSMYLNGTPSSSLDDYSIAINTDGIFRVGQWYHGGSNYLDGKLAELMIFNKVLSELELNIVHAYLSAKYNIPITNDYYNGDLIANGDNDLAVVGIGFENGATNLVTQSDGLELEVFSDFESGDYVIFGHNKSENFINTSDVNGSIVSRWDRAWWLDLTDAGNTMACNFTFSQIEGDIGYGGLDPSNRNNYKLIYRNGTSGNWTEIATASSITRNKIIFSSIQLNADGYYTVASIDNNSQLGYSSINSGYKGPGGVGENDGSSTLKVWLNAGDMNGADADNVINIEDKSGNNNDVIQETSLNIPLLDVNAVNGKAAISFNGANSYLAGNTNFSFTAPLTVFSVAYFNKLSQGIDDNDYVYSVGDGISRGDQISISRRKSNDEDDVANINKYYSWDGDTARYGNDILGQTWYAFTQRFFPSGSASLHEASLNGTDASATDNEVEVNANTNSLSIGRWNGNNHWLDGSFSELIVFNRNLNSAEIRIVEAYLGAKYGLNVNNDKYNGDEPSNGDNDLNIAGIGTEADGSNLGANSVGFILEQVSGFSNGDYVVVGHATEKNTINTLDAVDNLGTNQARWNRAWYMDVTNTGVVPVVKISFDFSDAEADGFPGSQSSSLSNINYSLLFRSSSSGIWTNMNAVPTINGDQVIFDNVSLGTDGYFTLGTSDIINSPLPVTLTSFDANYTGENIKITWTTSSEINSDYFLLKRTTDGINYTVLEQLTAAGNSTLKREYSTIDVAVNYAKQHYYILEQYDFNGDMKSYGPINAKNKTTNYKIKTYPTPTKDLLHISGLTPRSTLRLFKANGKLLLEQNNGEHSSVEIQTSPLEKGLYFLQIINATNSTIVKVIIE